MKNLIVAVMVLGLVGFAAAQDMTGLDSAKAGIAVESNQQGGGSSSAYDLLIANILRTEADYISRRQTREDIWLRWGVGLWGQSLPRTYYPEAWALWEQLSPAESAAAQVEFRASWNRVIAAGLN